MLQELAEIEERFNVVAKRLLDPDIIKDIKQYSKLNKEYKELEKITNKFHEYQNVLSNIKEAKHVLETDKDEEFRSLAKQELDTLAPKQESIEAELKKLLLPTDPNDSKNIVLEIRAGTGGDEASIFAGDLFRMYRGFAEKQGWKLNVIDTTEGTSGGYKEIICTIAGNNVYGMMKFESGVHRVQRVPVTETQGRVHTSAASVVVLPEIDDIEVNLNMNEIRKDTFCSSGPGGQSVNTTYSAIRLTHIPTGIVVSCQDEKSQIKNLEKALTVLRARIYELEREKQHNAIGNQRKSMVRSGDRSEKIRTYNYPQGRVTDHRIGFSVHSLPSVMNGNIMEFIENVRIADNAEKLKEGGKE